MSDHSSLSPSQHPDRAASADCDVAVIGAGPAGLAAAVALARSRRSVVVVDAGEPRNASAAGAHNVLSREGIAPRELLALGRQEATGYGVRFVDGRAVAARRDGDDLVITSDIGQQVRARRLLLASGLVDELPEVPGLTERWGSSVLHCPYCHGWEVRDRRIGVLATSPTAIHQVLLFRQLSDHVVFIRHTPDAELDEDQLEQLRALDIDLVDGPVARLEGPKAELSAAVMADGARIELDALVVAPRCMARTELYEQLGGVPADHPFGVQIPTGQAGRTDVAGVFAVGNASDLAASIVPAAGAGVLAGGMINADLVMEDTQRAVDRRRLAMADAATA